MDTVYRARPANSRSGYVIVRERTHDSGHKVTDELIWTDTLQEAQEFAELMNKGEVP